MGRFLSFSRCLSAIVSEKVACGWESKRTRGLLSQTGSQAPVMALESAMVAVTSLLAVALGRCNVEYVLDLTFSMAVLVSAE